MHSGWQLHVEEAHLHHAWAITVKLGDYGGTVQGGAAGGSAFTPRSPYASAALSSALHPQQPSLAASSSAFVSTPSSRVMERASAQASAAQAAAAAASSRRHQSGAPAPVGGAAPTLLLHQLLRLPCPHRCGWVRLSIKGGSCPAPWGYSACGGLETQSGGGLEPSQMKPLMTPCRMNPAACRVVVEGVLMPLHPLR